MGSTVHHHQWHYLSGWVNVLECYLLNMNFFERLLLSNDFKDVLVNLSNTPLKAYFTHVEHLYEFETLLNDYYYNRLFEIRSLLPDNSICDFFLIENDIHNLKQCMKAIIFGKNMDKYRRGSIDKDAWDDVLSGKATALPDAFKEQISLFKTKITSVKKERIPFIVDLISDGIYLRYIESFYDRIEPGIIRRYIKSYQLVKGLEIIRRAMILRFDMKLFTQFFLEGFDQKHLFRRLAVNAVWTSEKTLREILIEMHCNPSLPDYESLIQMVSSNLSQKISFWYEVVTDNYLLDMIRPVKFIAFGPERVFGYLCGLTVEVFNLKLVLGGKVHRIENNLLRERVRKTYA